MKGGPRPNSGRPRGRKSYQGKSESRRVIEARIRELNRRGIESAKQDARLAVQLLPYDEPRLANVVAHNTTEVHYVARIPTPILDIEEWKEAAKKTLLLSDK